MKRKPCFFACITLVMAVLLLSVLTGCGGSEKPPAEPAPPSVSEPEAVAPTPPADGGNDEPQHDPAPPEGDMVTVSNIEELLEAIGPHTGIMLEPG